MFVQIVKVGYERGKGVIATAEVPVLVFGSEIVAETDGVVEFHEDAFPKECN